MECTSITERKAALRAQVRRERAAIPPDLRRAQDRALFKAFLGLSQVREAATILVYWGVGEEGETTELIAALLASGKRVALPRCLPGRAMESRLYRGGRLVPSPFGIPEPGMDCPLLPREELDVILVPALCYDRRGFRLGQGGGYYDRFLPGCGAATVGLCYRELLREELPREEHDVPVGLLLTVDP